MIHALRRGTAPTATNPLDDSSPHRTILIGYATESASTGTSQSSPYYCNDSLMPASEVTSRSRLMDAPP